MVQSATAASGGGEVRRFPVSWFPPSGVRYLPSRKGIGRATVKGLELWNPADGTQLDEVNIPDVLGAPSTWAASPSTDWLLWASRDSGLHLIDLESREIRPLVLPNNAESYLSSESPGLATFGGVLHPDGTYEDSSQRFGPYQTACNVALSPQGHAAIAAYGQSYALVWDLRVRELRACLGEDGGSERPIRIHRVAWAPDGSLAMTRDSEGRIRLWDVANRCEVRCFRVRENPHRGALDRPADMPTEVSVAGGTGAIAFTPDSRYVVAADAAAVRVWEVSTGRERPTWLGHEAVHPIMSHYEGAPRISDIRFSADGQRALTVGVDATLRVWDVPSGQELWKTTPDPCCIDWADIAPDGRHVVWAGCPGMRLYAVDR